MAEDKKGFVIKDRRLFDDAGEVRGEPEHPGDQPRPEDGADNPAGFDDQPPAVEDLPEANFVNFIVSLSTTAIFHFGDYPDPMSGKSEKNLPAAKHTIDLLSMLKLKTEGNLSPDERQLLDDVLCELRMRYVREKSRE